MKKVRLMILKRLPNNLHQQIKVWSSILLLIVAVIYIINVSYMSFTNARNIKMLNSSKMQQIKNEIDIYSEKVNQIAASLVYTPSVYQYFSMDDRNRVINMEELTSSFSNTTMLEDDIKQISLYDADMELIAGREILWSGESHDFSESQKNKMEFGDMYVSDYNGLSYYTISFPVLDLADKVYGSRIGTSLFVMRTNGLKDLMEDMKVTDGSRMYLLDKTGAIIASCGDDSGEQGQKIQKGNGKGYYREECRVNEEGWKLVSFIPKGEIIFGEPKMYVNMTFVYLLVAALLIMQFFIFRKWVIVPLEQMDGFIKNILVRPDARMETKRKDEIGTVIKSLNHMLDEKEIFQNNMQESQKKMHEMELSKKEMQILAYRNQINPHFLYNTLNCIRAMAVYYDAENIAEMTMSLSEIFRYAVKGSSVVLLEEEIGYIKEYAKIMKYRFGGDVRIHVQVDEAAKKKKIIKLLLQPLVENAVFHGVERNLNGGDIFVNVQMEETGFLKIYVEDNGQGMTLERKQEVLNMMKQEEREDSVKEIGLSNVYKRLKLFYGKNAELLIESSQSQGTKILLIIPEQIQGEENV